MPDKKRVKKENTVLKSRMKQAEELVEILRQSNIEQRALISNLVTEGLTQNRVIIKLKRELKLKKTSEIDIGGLRCI